MGLALVATSAVLGLMGTDLVLPAVPSLPEALGGGPGEAQLVLAAYAGGTGVGLLAFGALGDRFATRTLLTASLLLTAVASFACALSTTVWGLIGLRAVQGAAASGPAVFAPAIVRAMFDEARAVRAIGALGSVEALAPALAPVLGAWLLTLGGWGLSFGLIGAVALALAAASAALPLVPQASRRPRGGYAGLLGDPVYLRYALSQAFVLGGLLVFVFGAPAVLVRGFGGTLADFVVMQAIGVATFILAANATAPLAARFGAERMIASGTALAAMGAAAMLAYGLAGGASASAVTALFVPVGVGLGLRGPPGFYRAVLASRGDDARGSAIVILATMAATAGGTAVVAPFIGHGLVPLASATFVLEVAALACLVLLPRLQEMA
jgi:predicted MFS family arabinose efflux permease